MGDSTIRDGQPAAARTRASADDRSSRSKPRSAFDFEERRDDQAQERHGDESLVDLVGDLAHQGGYLAQQQTKLVEAEIHSAIGDLKESMAAMAGAAVLGIAALGVFLMAISYLLGSFMPVWLGTLIVAVAALGVAYAMYASGKGKLQSRSLTMGRTRETMERAPAAISGSDEEMPRGR